MPFSRPTIIVFLLVLAVYLWLVSGVPVMLLGNADYDDALFCKLAISLKNSDWLGDYNHLTLAKGPFYPIQIAFNSVLGTPIFLGQAILYLAAGLVFLWGLAPIVSRQWMHMGLFSVYVFNPMVYSLNQTRIVRAGLYTPLVVLILALTLWWFNLRDRRLGIRICLAVGFGLVLFSYLTTREEGVWILPALGAAF